MLKLTTQQTLSTRSLFAWFKVFLLIALAAALSGIALPRTSLADPLAPTLIATAYTDRTLPTLRQGDRGRSVRLLQQILSDNGFLQAAGVRLGKPSRAVVDEVFGSITTSAVRDLQRRYGIKVTGRVNPVTWEVLDTKENPYRSPLPWK
jgi:peptidoglycan hydrolase-like protein with peptidoglycan-binding domain